jgi:hypothetical protein
MIIDSITAHKTQVNSVLSGVIERDGYGRATKKARKKPLVNGS